MRFRRLMAGAFAAAWLASAAFALPAGWLADGGEDGIRIYRHARGAMSGELRVLPEENSATTLAHWFRRKTDAGMAGIVQSRFEPAEEFRPGMMMMTGEGDDSRGRRVALVRLGCKRPDGTYVYAESSLSSDRPYVREAIGGLVSIFMGTCMTGANESAVASADHPQSTTPAPSTAPARVEQRKPPGPPPFAYVKAPGTGVKPADIEAILWMWRNEQAGMTMQVRTYYFLLLKDGSWRDGLPPVALEDFDAAASRAGEPKEWGRWTRSGGSYTLVYADGSSRKLDASSARQPARRDEKLDGTWEADSAYSSLWSVSRSHWEVSFDRDGRFSKSSGGSIVGGVGSAAAGNAVGGSVVHDDDGSSSTVGGPNFGGGSSRRRASTFPDRSGSYRLNGYTIELHYDSGRVERLSFCATSDRNNIFFDGSEMRRQKADKR
jgi:hypothetical protein